jgi:hypothetical protein
MYTVQDSYALDKSGKSILERPENFHPPGK